MVSNYTLSLYNSISFVGYSVGYWGPSIYMLKVIFSNIGVVLSAIPFKHIVSFYSFVMQPRITATANIQLDATLILRHPWQHAPS